MRTNYAKINQNKMIRIIRDYGLLHLLRRILNRLIFQPLIYLCGPKLFQVGNKFYMYFRHSYNTTFINERTVEIPLFLELLNNNESKRILEIGNVMSHYVKPYWTVVDKFESSEFVQNVDILEYSPENRFDLIFAISTFEHIGFDEIPKDSSKLISVIEHLKNHCLSENGKIVFSIPVGWNRELDLKIWTGDLKAHKKQYFERTSILNTWKQTTPTDAWFEKGYSFYGQGLIVVEL